MIQPIESVYIKGLISYILTIHSQLRKGKTVSVNERILH